MGMARAAMKCRHGRKESILAQCSINDIEVEASGRCPTPFKVAVLPATMVLSYGAIMSQRDFLSFASPSTARPSATAMMRQIVGIAALVVLFGAPVGAQVAGDSPNTGIGAAVANTPNRAGGISHSSVPAGTRSDYQGEQQYRETLKRISGPEGLEGSMGKHPHSSDSRQARAAIAGAPTGVTRPPPANSRQNAQRQIAAYSITSSARASSGGGTLSPSALAAAKLITRSNLVGCSTVISPGFVPRKILSTKSAARRNRSEKFGP